MLVFFPFFAFLDLSTSNNEIRCSKRQTCSSLRSSFRVCQYLEGIKNWKGHTDICQYQNCRASLQKTWSKLDGNNKLAMHCSFN